jgi:hypothetical protein
LVDHEVNKDSRHQSRERDDIHGREELAMNVPREDHVTAAASMTDDELISAWQNASDEETENLSPRLSAVIDEMERRNLSL